MDKFIGKFSPQIYALLRIVAGFMFLCHGADKLFGAFGGDPANLMTQKGIGGVIEFFGGLLIMVGFQASWAAFLCSGTMAVAYWQMHFDMSKPLPLQNRGELAALYCFVFLYLAAKGSGIWSVDALMGKKKSS